jgi:hypothetical protein
MLVLATWFTFRSSTGSRRCFVFAKCSPALPPQRSSGRVVIDSASVTQATGRLEQASGKATEVVSASPDTGQQGCDVDSFARHRVFCLLSVGDDRESLSKSSISQSDLKVLLKALAGISLSICLAQFVYVVNASGLRLRRCLIV